MKKKNLMLRISYIVAFLVLFGLGQNAWAQTNTWNVPGNGNWNSAGNWALGVPTASHDVVIPTGITVTIDEQGPVDAAAKSITLNGSAILQTSVNTITVEVAQSGTGAITLNGTSRLFLNQATVLTIGSTTYRGNIVMNDNSVIEFATAASTISLSGTWTKGDDATITNTVPPNFTFNGSTALSLPATVNNAVALTVNKVGSTVTLNGAMTTTGIVTITNGTLIVGDNNFTAGGATTINAGATLNANYTDSDVSRIFTGVITLDGTLNASGLRDEDVADFNNTFTAALSIPATGVLNIDNSKSRFTTTVTGLAGSTLSANGTDLYFNGVVTFTNLTFNTNSNTDLTLVPGAAQTLPALSCKNLTLTAAVGNVIMGGNITVYGDLTIASAGALGLDVVTYTLTVYGDFNNSTGTSVIDLSDACTLNLYGSVTDWGNSEAEFLTGATTTLNILGSGSLVAFPAWGAANFGNLTMNRAGEEFDLTAATAASTFNSLIVTAGNVLVGDFVNIVSTTTVIGANGTLDLSGAATALSGITFTTGLSGTGTIIAAEPGATATAPTVTIAAGCNYAFTGTMTTDLHTDLVILSTQADDITLPSSITHLNELVVTRGAVARKVILSNNLTLTPAIAATEFVSGRLVLNGYTLTLTTTFTAAAAANFILDATSGSTIVFGGVPTLIAGGIVADETTNFQFEAASVMTGSLITTCNNITIVGANAVTTPAGAFSVYGNIDIQGGGSILLNTNATNITVYGDISVAATPGIINATGATINLHGQMAGAGTYTFTDATTIVIAGSSAQFIMPAGVATIGQLTLNRSAGMKINSNITVGSATLGLTITNGDLDLNGYVITLGNAATVISETAGNTVINTGATLATGVLATSRGCIGTAAGVTPGLTGQAVTSGIGLANLAAAGNVQVLRFPITIPVPGVGLSTARVYQILTNNVTAVSFIYDNTELYSSASDLRLYTAASTDFAFAVATDQTEDDDSNRDSQPNVPEGKGFVAYSSMKVSPVAAGSFYALAALPGDGGVMRTFAVASGNWSNASNWSPAGVPTKVDQVVIQASTVTVDGEGQIYEFKTLNMAHPNGTLQPANTATGDVVTLRGFGNVTLIAGAEILGVNGTGRINLEIGDGASLGVSSTFSIGSSYVPTSGMWIQNFAVNGAEVSTGASFIRVSGDVTVGANSELNLENVEFWGGFDSNQQISVENTSSMTIDIARFDNNANVTTTSNLNIDNHFLVKSGSSFNATGGTAFFATPLGAGTPWNVENNGTLRFYNVEFNSSGVGTDFVPVGVAYIQGNFWQYGTDAFAPTSGKVVFSNTSQFEIVNSQLDADLEFYVLEIAAGSGVKTSSDFQISHQIDVKQNASLIADYGMITFVGDGWIKNASTQTLEFNDLTIDAGVSVQTNDSWKIKGDFSLVDNLASFIANNGTITFENFQEKTIDANNTPGAGGTIRFHKLRIADGAKVTTPSTGGNLDTRGSFTIANNATYPTGAGIEVLGNGEFYVGDATAVTTFNVVGAVAAGYPKVISKSTDGILEFGLLTIAATNNNEVTTSSDFTLTGTGADVFNNAGAGGKFTATAGMVTFTGAAPEITSVSPAVTQFYSLRTEGTTALTYPNAGAPTIQEFLVAGDITIDDQSSIVIPDDDAQTKVIFNGDGLQTIGGNTLADPAIAIPSLVLNKANNSHLLLDIDVVLGEVTTNNDDQFVLTNGILNLGSSTLTVHSDVISRSFGAIYGNEGTYVIGENHQTPKLEDVYFTIDGEPTLYNLTVDEAHTIANDLTVNGTLNLNLADLTIGDGADANNPMKLIVYGDLTRATGEIDGNPTESRLVLTGTGTVIGGLTNDFFTGGTATTVQLEIARQETLGGNLNIAATSYLIINNSVNSFDIGTYTLALAADAQLYRLSGGIDASAGTVSLGTDPTQLTIPGNLFIDDVVYNLTLTGANDYVLGGNLIINGILSYDAALTNETITTNDHILTFGPNATLPAFDEDAHVIGNMRRYVNNDAKTFHIGGGTGNFRPVTLQFANTTTYQPFVISSQNTNPVYGRGGNATRAITALWSITPEGTAPFDSLKVEFGWDDDYNNGTTPVANVTFPAKWENLAWTDYRSSHGLLSSANFVADKELAPLANRFPYSSADALAGDWAVFVSETNSNASKDSAIAVTYHRLVVTDVTPNPVVVNFPFTVTVELQDRFGNAVKVPTADGPYEITFTGSVNPGAIVAIDGFIQPGQSSVTLPGFTYGTQSVGNQFTAEVTDPATTSYGYIMPGISPKIDVLFAQPAEQVNNIILTTGTLSTTMRFALTGEHGLIMAKAGSAITEAEFPVDGVTYFASRNFGEGSTIGDAVVVYKGAELAVNSEITIYNLAPNTTYYFRGFAYDAAATAGTENYRTTASSGNPRAFTTTGGIDDDVTYGTNNSFAQAKAIGTNTTVRGTIKSATDEDWFSFTVTNGAPNIRTRLELGGDLGNYNIEVYDRNNNLIRRGIRLSNLNESPVVNELPAGTYVVRIFGVNEAYNASTAYVLTVKTSSDEIFSVTE